MIDISVSRWEDNIKIYIKEVRAIMSSLLALLK
jgi:hypothetical protein